MKILSVKCQPYCPGVSVSYLPVAIGVLVAPVALWLGIADKRNYAYVDHNIILSSQPLLCLPHSFVHMGSMTD